MGAQSGTRRRSPFETSDAEVGDGRRDSDVVVVKATRSVAVDKNDVTLQGGYNKVWQVGVSRRNGAP